MLIAGEVGHLVDSLVFPKRHIKFAALVKSTEAIVAGSVEIIEDLRRFCTLTLALPDQIIESCPLAIMGVDLVFHENGYW